jgi:hypothetical protein
MYRDYKDYAGEVDHSLLILQLEHDYDGFCLHTASVTLPQVLRHLTCDYRIMAWVKPFAAFKANVSVAYAWEPVIVKACRKPVVKPGMTYRDWVASPITMQKGLVGAKPATVCRWLFEVMGCQPDDELVDLFPGTGAIGEAWEAWRRQLNLLTESV